MGIRHYKRRSRAEWRQLIEQQRQSELSQVAFCKQHDIVFGTFQNWKRRLSEETSDGPERWLELPPAVQDGPGGNGWDIELNLGGGLCLRFRRR